ncbi:FAD-binding protein [Nocardia sp. NPDC052566]|uniref:FAD-dependent oxidoreductase n=1 Tax=Nocardia sp. NPDC052566 TaxID=3364330 RepID=UPI0037C5B4C2
MGDWDGLRAAVRGRVVLPGEGGFATAKQLFDTRFDAAAPVAVVQVTSEQDVQAAVDFAGAHGLTVTVRSGGHSYVGASAADSTLVIDMRGLNDVRYETGSGSSGSAVVGGGASLYAVHQRLAESGQTLPLGSCATVSTGLTLGGGVGVESRRYGLSCDRLERARLVLADRKLVEVSATNQPDLFWALRGGGGGQVGVVTSLTYRTCPAITKDIVQLTFPGAAVARVLTGWADWLRTTDRDTWANIVLGANGAGGVTCRVLLVCPAGKGDPATTTLAAATGAVPLTTNRRTFQHLDAVRFLAGDTDPPRTVFVAGSDVVPELSIEVAAAVAETLGDRSRSGLSGGVILDPLDGAVQDIPIGDTAFPWRKHTAVMQWFVAEPNDPGEAAHWITTAHDRLGAHSVGGYVNYLEPGYTPRRYFAENLDRLRRIRAVTDPVDRFRSSPALW